MQDRKLTQYRVLFWVSTWVSAVVAWTWFFFLRNYIVDNTTTFTQLFEDVNYAIGVGSIPVLVTLFLYLTDVRTDIFRRSRLQHLFSTLFRLSVVCILLFFAILLDDHIRGYQDYINYLFLLFAVFSICILSVQLLWLNALKKKISRGQLKFPSIVIADSKQEASKLLDVLTTRFPHYGFQFDAYYNAGALDEKTTLEQKDIVYTRNQPIQSSHVLAAMAQRNVDDIWIASDLLNDFSGHTALSYKVNEPLAQVFLLVMPRWQRFIKRVLDIVVSFFCIMLLSPIIVWYLWIIPRRTEGKAIYRQERIGKNSVPFMIYKFRTMIENAEPETPLLSSDNDARVTDIGKYLRKWRLDEIPQFLNVLKGEMSLVGPRPERIHFIEKISQKNMDYPRLLSVRPGITSWGQIKYGYASNVGEMLERLKYDLLYIENMSLALDFKIMFYTIFTLLKGTGK